MKASYNTIAPFYDLLSRLVFGSAVVQSQRFLINAIPAGSNILIAGGGTGYILEEITKKFSQGLTITYVDISEKMIALSRLRNTGSNEVVFIHQSITEVLLNQMFSVVITPFFLDNFNDDSLKIIFDKLHASLQLEGLWLFADFEINKESSLWEKALLQLMYFFFRFFCNIEAASLPDTQMLFKNYCYQAISKKTFFREFICSVIYRKE